MTRAASQHAVLSALGAGCLRVSEVAAAVSLSYAAASMALGHLVSRGLAERVQTGCYRRSAAGQALIDAGAPIPWRRLPHHTASRPVVPRPDSMRSRLWRAARLLAPRPFTSADLVHLAARADDVDPQQSASAYLRHLHRAGYLARVPRRAVAGKARLHRYVLLRDTGPAAPVLASDRSQIRDANTGEVVRWQG
ncbi:MAG: hypothetical protein OHK0024_35950 [Thalassobaculales bacterium]